MKYDDASWHYGGEFPEDLPEEAGGTHIGMFAAWAVLAGLGGEICDPDSGGEEFITQLRDRTMTPGTFAFVIDGKLTNDDFNDEGNAFAASYYEKTYLEDYGAMFEAEVDDLYRVPDTWATYDRLKPVLDRRLAEWRAAIN